MWNMKNETSEQIQQKRNRLMDTENKLVVAKGEGDGRMSEIIEGD